MTVSVQIPFNESVANGVTTVFPYTFKLLDANDLIVKFDGVAQISGFTISGIGNDTGGNINFSVAPANGVVVLISRILSIARVIDYQENGDFLAETVNKDYDRIWQALQQFAQQLKSAIKLPFSTSTDQTINDNAATRADKLLGFDSSGNVILKVLANLATTPVSVFMAGFLNAANAAAARAILFAAGTGQTIFNDRVNLAAFNVAAHATICDIWTGGNVATLTGGAVTFTNLAAAPQAGVTARVNLNAAHVFTNNANLTVDGGTWTGAAGAWIEVLALTTTTFRITPHNADGTAVVGASSFESITAVQAASALTCTLKAGSSIKVRSANPYSGVVTNLPIAADTSVVIPNGATLGAFAAITDASATMAGTTTLTLNVAPSAAVHVGAIIFQAGTRDRKSVV